jgi:hypothetical protein
MEINVHNESGIYSTEIIMLALHSRFKGTNTLDVSSDLLLEEAVDCINAYVV